MTSHPALRATAVALAIACCAAPLAAQTGTGRSGVWFGFGFGGGSEANDCSGCGAARTLDLAGSVSLGGTLGRHLLLGGQLTGWSHSAGGVDAALGFVTAVVTWYPAAAGPLFLDAGLGGMSYSQSDGTTRTDATAGALQLGLGYDLRARRNLSITPFVTAFASTPAAFSANGVPLATQGKVTISLVLFGVGLTWH